MPDDNYVNTPGESNFKRFIGAMKNGYSYLHPDYRTRKLIQQIFIAPLMFIVYGLIYGLILMNLTGMTNDTMPVILKTLDLILIIISTFLSAYFYPFSYWWYRQSFIGTLLNNMYFFGAFWAVILKVIGTFIAGIIIAGILGPITGPLTIMKCKRKNMIIGDAGDFAGMEG